MGTSNLSKNIGTLNTYGSHVQIATFSIAALLIGGASVSKSTIGQTLLGVIGVSLGMHAWRKRIEMKSKLKP